MKFMIKSFEDLGATVSVYGMARHIANHGGEGAEIDTIVFKKL